MKTARLLVPTAFALATCLGFLVACQHKPTAEEHVRASDQASGFGHPTVVSLKEVGIDPDAMDKTADPCNDFYQFACGNWVSTFQLPPDKSRWVRSFTGIDDRNLDDLHAMLDSAASSPADDVQKKMGDYYAACNDEVSAAAKGLAALRPLRDEIGKVRNVRTLAAALASLHRRKVWAFFDVSSEQDRKEATRVILDVDQSGLGLPDRDYYLKDDDRSKAIREFYLGHLERMFGLLGEKPAEAKKAAAEVMKIETKLAGLSQSRVERREPANTYHKIDLAGLAGTAKSFAWGDYFAAIGYSGVTDINVSSPKFMTGMDALIKAEKAPALRHYLEWHLVHSYASTLSKPFVQENFALAQKLSGAKELEPRWKRCVRATDAALGELVGQLYVAKDFPGESKTIADGMVKAITSAMTGEIASVPWMDDATRKPAQGKIDKMAYQIGYPEKWRTYDLTLGRDSYTANAMAARELDFHYGLDQVGKPLDRSRWNMTPPTVNAYYSQSLNEMVFPAGILQSPFFDKNHPSAVNYGGIGVVMGHELTHAFDDKGSQYDADGNLNNWWSPSTGDQFKSKTGCVVEQYGNYEPLPPVATSTGGMIRQTLNGKLTTGENIADIGGVKLAWQAWQKARAGDHSPKIVADGFSEEQLFFLSFGQIWCEKILPEDAANRIKVDPHSPGRFRVTGALADTPQFAEAFSCKAKTQPTCTVW